jgi:cell wall-associated NlpC family hydrolase
MEISSIVTFTKVMFTMGVNTITDIRRDFMKKNYWKKAWLAIIIMLTVQFSIFQVEASAQSVGEEIASDASDLIGTSYRLGGTSPSTGFDTSGFIQYLHKQQGLSIPRTVSGQANSGTTILKTDIKPGDVIIFKDDRGNPSISSIYIGNDRVIAAIPAFNGVGQSSISTSKAKEQYLVAKRYFNLTENSNLISIIKLARELEGTPYSFGGRTPSAFDTSGFIYYILGEHDISVPRRVADQWQEGTSIKQQNLRPGDLVFFDAQKKFEAPSNVGMYVEDNRFIMAASQFGQVAEKNLSDYAGYFMGAKRLEAISGTEESEPSIPSIPSEPSEPPVQDEPTKNEAVIVSTVNFRKAPSNSSTTYGILPTGTIVNVIEEYNRYWLKVEVKGIEGYISASSRFVDYTGGQEEPAPTPDPIQEPVPEPTPDTETLADQIIVTGEKYFGTPYLFGARSGSGYFDCSLFTQTIFAENGIRLPRSSRQQAQMGTFVEWGEWKKGDLIFFWTRATGEGIVGHVAVYAGDGKILHTYGSPGVKYSDINYHSWKNTYMGAKRVLE